MTTDEQEQDARQKLTDLSAAFTKAEARLEVTRKALNEGIAEVLMARTLGPSEVTRLVPYERQHVGRIAKAAGVPPLRERTVVSAKKTAAASQRPAAAPRWEGSPAKPSASEPPAELGLSPAVAALTEDQVRLLAGQAEAQHQDWGREIRRELRGTDPRWIRYAIVEAAAQAGYVDLKEN
ncbi:hypothetical protein ACFQ6V_23720 [Streptomyces roseifaciens]